MKIREAGTMKEKTRYNYEQRIKELEDQVYDLENYKQVSVNIFNTVTDMIAEGKGINTGWIVKQYRGVFK